MVTVLTVISFYYTAFPLLCLHSHLRLNYSLHEIHIQLRISPSVRTLHALTETWPQEEEVEVLKTL